MGSSLLSLLSSPLSSFSSSSSSSSFSSSSSSSSLLLSSLSSLSWLGIPGAVRMLTLSNEVVTWTKLTNTNKPTLMVDFYPLWSIKYLLLTKKGKLYLFTTMYDAIEKAELILDLRRPSNLIVEDLTIHLKVGVSDRISFVMDSRDEITQWQ